MRAFYFVFFTLILLGCKSNQEGYQTKATNLYLDHEFSSEQVLESPEQLFHLNTEMKRYVQNRLLVKPTVKERIQRLMHDLFDPNQLNIQYLHNANLTAEQVFDQGMANCLSLTILSYVLVQEADMAAAFMDVKVQENWSFNNGMATLNGHVNLKVFRQIEDNERSYKTRIYTVDFLPMLNIPQIGSQVLNKQQIVALFYNNKGAEALASGDRNLAYQYFKQSTLLDSKNAANWGNLASLYRQAGFITEAEQVFHHAMALDPNNLNVQENLALLYKLTDRQDLAIQLNNKILKARLKNPYFHAMLAEQNYNNGEYDRAVKKYKEAATMNPLEHLFAYGIAKSYWRLEEYSRAKRYLKLAQRLADNSQDKNMYQSKITALQSIVAQKI